ncbi:GLI pathogenesis-related 2 [Sardina pilchardus]|uniref:GLI pathogenesis-related 2 n=1 Tax=Sardina pilchardus TaxID=27697 RepID=UPI002E117A5D
MAGSAFEKEFLEAHNTYRQRHGASPLTLNKELSRSAQKWAEYLLASKTMQHSQADYGENLYYAWSSAPKQLKGKEAVDSWYNEIKDYSFSRPGFQSNTGHFTQVVWKGSEKLGVGLATDGNTVFVVGQYLPAGNISNPGYFQKNVLPAGSSVAAHSDAVAGSGGNDRGSLPSRQSGSDNNSSSLTGSTFDKETLEAHNTYRQRHGASPLTLNKELSRSAQKWAEYLLASNKMQHSQADYGENLYYTWSSAPKQLEGKEAVDNWYNEIKDYSFSRPGFQSKTGHFTQVVWKGSEKLGVGLATDGKTSYVVCQYLPAGNISNPGYFQKNVLPAGSSVAALADAGARSGGNDRGSLPSNKSGSDHNSSSLTGSSFDKETLEAHNTYRQQHGAAPLTLNRELSRSAQKWAKYLLASNKMQHSQADYGENLYYAWSSAPKQLKGKEAVDNWYNEIKDYSFSRPGFQSNTGHFTQVVWKGSEKLGVGLATDGKTSYVVCQYLPAGNISNPGYFQKNVLPAGSSVAALADAVAGFGLNDRDSLPSKKSESDHNSSSLTGSAFDKETLEAHNTYRQRHGAAPLTLNRELSRSAQKWAKYLLASNKMQHSQADYGENLYYAWSSAPKQVKGKEAVDSWYNEIKDYSFSRPGFQSNTGHFTQVVWKGSEKLGVGLATDGKTTFVVCQYLPAGNISNPGYFQKNVLPAGS